MGCGATVVGLKDPTHLGTVKENEKEDGGPEGQECGLKDRTTTEGQGC
jgi:hypothetical protein